MAVIDSDSESETDSESIPSAQETLTSVTRRVGKAVSSYRDVPSALSCYHNA